MRDSIYFAAHATAQLRRRVAAGGRAIAAGAPWPLAMAALFFLAPVPALAGCSDSPGAGVDWTDCQKFRLILRQTNLVGARLGGTDFNGSDLQKAKMAGADLSRASVDRVRLSGADLSRAKMVQLNGYRANFSGANLTGVDLSKAELLRANLTGANLSGANLRKAELLRAVLEGANLSGANLSGADMARANLIGAKLDGTKLAQARMFRTRLEGVDLSAATGLLPAQLESACGNAKTRLPKDFKIPTNWPCDNDE